MTYFDATLYLQSVARDMIAERRAGVQDETSRDRLAEWAAQRIKLASAPLETHADAVASTHSLLQIAGAIEECRDHPDGFGALLVGLVKGLEQLRALHERALGRTAEDLGLFRHYEPPGSMN